MKSQYPALLVGIFYHNHDVHDCTHTLNFKRFYCKSLFGLLMSKPFESLTEANLLICNGLEYVDGGSFELRTHNTSILLTLSGSCFGNISIFHFWSI